MGLNKRLIGAGATGAGGLVPSEHFGVVLYEGDGASGHSINGGKFGAGAYFDGTAYIDLNHKNTYSSFSISAWVNVKSTSSAQSIISRWFDGSNRSFAFYMESGGQLKLYTSTNGSDTVTTTGGTLNANTWHFVCVTFQSSGNITITLDGSTTTTAQNTTVYNNNQNWLIGMEDSRGGQKWNGKIDQVRFFTKALSSSQVSTLYAETAATVESLDPLNVDTTDTLQVLGDTSCVATYRFENDETDLSGNYDGTGTAIQYAAGRYGQSASFNGTDSKINIGDSDNFASNKITFSFWANPGSGNSSNYHILFSNYVTGSLADGDFTIARLTNQKLEVGVSAAGGGRFYIHTSSAVFTNNTWKHYVVVVDNTQSANADKVNVYVDNVAIGFSVLDASGTVSGNLLDNTSDLFIGYWANDTTHGYNGEIDQVRIFNKAISAAEVTTLYNENPLVASYRFEGNANDDMRNYNGTASNVTYEYGLGFQPDFIWTKSRTNSNSHALYDSTRGINKELNSNSSDAEGSLTDGISSFDTGGFTVGARANSNQDGQDFVGWCLKANGGTTSSNTDGNITSTVQANQDAGFSIITYTGTGGGGKTIGHGLGVEPSMYITKRLNHPDAWRVTAKVIEGYELDLAGSYAKFQDGAYPDYATSSVIILGTGSAVNTSGGTYVTYCFANIDGFSKIGSYTGNSSDNGPIVETGFEPAFLMIKNASDAGSWFMYDNKRNTSNPRINYLLANGSNVEASDMGGVDFLSNGFQIKEDHDDVNDTGDTYIYMAFAADPDTETPTVAKSFNIKTYTGNSNAAVTVEGYGFSPSLVWAKSTNTTNEHNLYDTVRGATFKIRSDSNSAESYQGALDSFTDDGFTLSDNGWSLNQSGNDYIAWAWKADDNEPTINEEGSIDSIVSANANAGFSIVKYNGTGSAATIGHGLSSAPELIFSKRISSSADWVAGVSDWTKYLELNGNPAFRTASSVWNNTAPTSTVFSVAGSGGSNGNGETNIAYCFHSVSGYSKIGSYTGDGTTTKTITTGFQPDFVLIKTTDNADNWVILDSVRGGSKNLKPNSSAAEATESGTNVEFISTGFKLIGSGAGLGQTNGNGNDYIYMAIKIN